MAGSFKKRAERGFKFMNELMPDWKSSIDAESLDLGSETQCILGQLFGDFTTGYTMICKLYRERYNVAEDAPESDVEWWDWITKHGFALFQKPDPEDGHYCSPRSPALRKRHAALTQAWKELLGTSPA